MNLLGNRHVIIVCVFALCIAATGCEGDVADKSASPVRSESAANPQPAPKNKKVYRYEDAEGNLHFVTGRHNIPPQYLANATAVDGSKLETYESETPAQAEEAPEKPAEPEGFLTKVGSFFSGIWQRIYNWFSPPPLEPGEPKYEGPPDLAIYDLSGKAWFTWCKQISAALNEQVSAQAAEQRKIQESGSYGRVTTSRRVAKYDARDGRTTTRIQRSGRGYSASGETLEVYNAGKAADDAIMEAAHLRKDALAAGNVPEWVLDGNCEGQQSPVPPTWPERHPLYYQQQAAAGR